jgi:hypothetical protein
MTVEYGLWHTIRHADGSWQIAYDSIDGAESNPVYAFSDAACAATATNVQVVAVGPAGQLYHTVRNANGSYQPSFGIVESVVSGAPGPFKAACCAAAANDDVHVVALALNGQLWHTVRHADGSWQSSFVAVPGAPGPVSAVDAVHVDDDLIVAVVGPDGWVYTTKRDDGNGWWDGAFILKQGQPNADGPYTDVAIARAGNDAQIVTTSQGGVVYHAWFQENWWWPTWQGSWNAIAAQESNDPAPFGAVSCSLVDGGDLHVLAIGDGGQMFHTIRHPDGSWQSWFGWVNGQESNGFATFSAIGSAGASADLHVVGLAWQHD